MQRSVSIIGLGHWGSSLAHALTESGSKLDEVVIRRARPAARLDRTLPVTTFHRARLDADVLWLCVPDHAIPRVAARVVKQVGQRGLQGQIVVHSSGALSTQVLETASAAGALVAAVHPMMSFPTSTPIRLQGVPFGVEAPAAGRRILNAIIRRMGGRPFAIRASHKTLYHLAGTLSSPLLVSHLAAVQEVAARAGFSARQAQQLIEPIVRATLDNFFLRGAAKSFSGPIARGDVQTIHLHLQALESHPMLTGVYRSLALYALEVLPAGRRKQLRASLQPK